MSTIESTSFHKVLISTIPRMFNTTGGHGGRWEE